MPTSQLQDPVAEAVGRTAEEAAAKLLQVSSEGHECPYTFCCQATPCLQTLTPADQAGGCLQLACWESSVLTCRIFLSERMKHLCARHACNSCTALQVRQEQAGLLPEPQERTDMIQFKGRLMPYDEYVRDHLRRPYDEPAESRDARRAAIFEAVEQQGWTVRGAAA